MHKFIGVLLSSFFMSGCGESTIGASSAAAANSGSSNSSTAVSGAEVFRQNGCGSCHATSSASGSGPGLGGIYGSKVTLSDGTSVTVDDAYLKTSISAPGQQLVQGYRRGMPSFSLSDAEMAAIIDYIKSLK